MSDPGQWYPDPQNPRRMRYWDGTQWTGHTAARLSQRGSYRPARVAAWISVIGVMAIAGAQVVVAGLAGPAYERYMEAAAIGEDPSVVWAPYNTAGLVADVLFIVAGLVTIVWLSIARANAEALRPMSPHKRSRGWAWGGWICPVVCLWFPYQVVRDVERATSRRPRRDIGWWWATWLVFFFGVGGLADVPTDADVAQLRSLRGIAMATETVVAAAAMAAAALWFVIVRRIMADQAAAARSGAQPGALEPLP